MKRWGMLDEDGSMPEPNINVKMAIKVLDEFGDGLPLTGLATLIPLLECALDGALVKFLLEEVEDPVCHEVFRHINSDEARHITVDFQVLELIGAGPLHKLLIESIGNLKPQVIVGLIVVFVPLINKMRDNIVAMGLPEQKLYNAVKRFATIGGRGEYTQADPGVPRAPGAGPHGRSTAATPTTGCSPTRWCRLTGFVPARLLGPAAGLGRRDHPRTGGLVRLLSDEEWRGHDFSGERVGVIADGRRRRRGSCRGCCGRRPRSRSSSAEPTWVLPVRLPVVGKVAARLNLRLSVKDPWTRRRLTPGRFGRQDVTLSRRYYDAIRHPKVTLVTWPVYAVTDDGVRTGRGHRAPPRHRGDHRNRSRGTRIMTSTPDHEVAIIGGGFSGIGAAILLERAGFDDYLMIEEGDGVGGAWHWNTYPGIGVDIPSFSYQFSFEQTSRWSRVYAPGAELKAYAEHCMDKYDVRRRTRLEHPRRRRRPSTTSRTCGGWTPRPATRSPRGSWSAPPACSPSRRTPTSRASRTSAAPSCTPRAGTTTST